MRRALLASVLALAACGDNILPDGESLHASPTLAILAHQDDDLIFMQPDLLEDMQSTAGVTNVYVTAGNGTKGVDYSQTREEGLRSAYASATGNAYGDWTCGWIAIADHEAEHCRLDAANLSLVFLDYPDGGELGTYPNSLLDLWEGTIDQATTVAVRPTTYTQADLVTVIGAIITDTQPGVIRALEVASTHGRDHIDHMIVGALALLGAASAGSEATIESYRGYDTESEPANLAPPLVARTSGVLDRYEACAIHCAPCGEACDAPATDHQVWIQRRYAVGFRAPLGPMQVRDDDFGQCLTIDGDDIQLAECATAPAWSLTAGGALQSGDRCAQRLPTGELVAAQCDATAIAPAVERWFVDDEGHVWSGVAPTPVTGMDYMHLDCLAAGAALGKAHTDLCGMGHAPTWTFTRAPVTTAIALAAPRGTALRLGDLDGDGKLDLATVGATGELVMYAGAGDGTFAMKATSLGAFAVDAHSLALGDLDGDGKADACGFDATGILCLIGGAATHVLLDSAAPGIGMPDASLAILDGQVCYDAGGELACTEVLGALTAHEGTTASALWAADLDGDGHPDACSLDSGATGLSCAIAVDRAQTQTPALWAFVNAGVVDGDPSGIATTQLADLDGDGRADACDLDAMRVACARSQGHGLGPRYTTLGALAPLPAGADTLLLGDLDGDGRADVCVASATGVTCALSP